MQTNYRYKDPEHIHAIVETQDDKEVLRPLMGTTTLIYEVLPPPLSWWASGMALTGLGWTNKKHVKEFDGIETALKSLNELKTMSGKEYYDLLQKCYKAHDDFKKDAGEYGTDAHNAIEIAVKHAIAQNGGYLDSSPYEHEAVERFAEWGRGKMFIHSEVHVFSEKLWVGGIVDLVYMENDKFYLGDVKTSKTIYPTHLIQMGLYDNLQEENGFVNQDGLRVGEKKDIAGYTVINVPRNQSGIVVKTCPAERIKKEVPALVGFYKLLKDLDIIIK